jgi:predicted nucleic acid-binding protein
VATHPAVIGELACGSPADRENVLRDLAELPGIVTATHEEALSMIEAHSLMGLGIGYLDVLLLASCAITPGTRLWTRDARLAQEAEDLDLRADG